MLMDSGALTSAMRIVLGQTPAAPAPAGGFGGGGMMIVWVVAIIGIFYFFIMRPQRTREKERRGMIDTLKKGDQVITIGGVYGSVVSIKEDSVVLRVDEERDIHMRYMKSAISRVLADESQDEKDKKPGYK